MAIDYGRLPIRASAAEFQHAEKAWLALPIWYLANSRRRLTSGLDRRQVSSPAHEKNDGKGS